MLNLRKQKTAMAEIAGEGGSYRFTFARVSAMGDMRYHAYRSKANKFIKSITGQEIEKIIATLNTVNADQNALAVAFSAMAHPRIISSLQAIHFREDGSEVDAWTEQPIPEDWREIEAFFEAVDKPEIAILDAAATECNRDLWFVEQSDTAKKKDSVKGK